MPLSINQHDHVSNAAANAGLACVVDGAVSVAGGVVVGVVLVVVTTHTTP